MQSATSTGVSKKLLHSANINTFHEWKSHSLLQFFIY